MDCIFELAYRHNDDIKKMIDSVPLNNANLHKSRYMFNEKCQEDIFRQLLEQNQFMSLTWRIKYNEFDDNGDITYYGKLVHCND